MSEDKSNKQPSKEPRDPHAVLRQLIDNETAAKIQKKTRKYKLNVRAGFPVVFSDLERRSYLLSHIPPWKVQSLRKNPKCVTTTHGPSDLTDSSLPFRPFMCGRSMSTYPNVPGRPCRDGDPVCDSFCINSNEDSSYIVVTDGCNWGVRPQEASNRAREKFTSYLANRQNEIQDLTDAGHILLECIAHSHYAIMEGKSDVWEAGTTTILGGIVMKFQEPRKIPDNELQYTHVFVFVSVGDCKAYHYDHRHDTVSDLTMGNRRNVHDARDCGGRIGPYVGEGSPDLRNIAVYYTPCSIDDMLIIVSDGVHDNLDPEILGVYPSEIDSTRFQDTKNWNELPNDETTEALKTGYMCNLMRTNFVKPAEDEQKQRMKMFAFNPPEMDKEPAAIVSRLMKHCLSTTSKGRQFMEQNPRDKLPMDYRQYPGKMDHATCAILKIHDQQHVIKTFQANKAAPKS